MVWVVPEKTLLRITGTITGSGGRRFGLSDPPQLMRLPVGEEGCTLSMYQCINVTFSPVQ